jgi:phenylalanyl-tRNA synthetase beta chain
MKVPLSWLKEYVPAAMPVAELAHRLTMAGVEVGAVEQVGGAWEHCFVGHVLSVEPHPNADRLTLCTVEIGGELLRVVCGAPNVAAGQKIAFAKAGAMLHDAHSGRVEALRAAKIRGQLSEGMICSELELGLGGDHAGILVLPQDAPVGAPLADYLGDAILDLEVTANRPDCLSLLGVAYEVGAFSGAPVRQPDLAYPEAGRPIREQVTIAVLDPDLCPRYTASLVTGVTVGPSPRWMQERLTKAGMRPINNVVDVTNYVMLEYGQPLHAFDYNTLKGKKIIVRQARPGEVLVSLDGVERKLAPPMVVIADERDPVGLGGVIGGATSEVTAGTTAVLLESASFHPLNTRRTAGALGLRTEASLRFEKGLRPELPLIALRRATQLLLQVAGGTAAQGITDVYPGRREAPAVALTLARLEKVLGMRPPLAEVRRVLASLGFEVHAAGDAALKVTPPPWRADISLEDDLVEEVARVVGYDALPTTMLSTPIPYHQPDPPQELKERVRDLLVAGGFQEAISYPLVSREALERAGALAGNGAQEPLRLSNPMSHEHEWLRTSLRPSLLLTLATNWRHEEGPIRLFELGRVYLPQERDLPQEREIAAAALTGPRQEPSWHGQGEPLGFYDAKGVAETLLERLGLHPSYEPAEDPFFLPGRVARMTVGGEAIGCLGEVHPSILERFDIGLRPVAFLELELPALLRAVPPGPPRFQHLPRFPGAPRDLAILVPTEVSGARVQEILERHPLVARATLFDVYAGPQVPSGVRSLAYRLLFQSSERTLTAEEVSHALEELLVELQREAGAVQRQG